MKFLDYFVANDTVAVISSIIVLWYSLSFFYALLRCCNTVLFLAFPIVNNPLLESTLSFLTSKISTISHNAIIIKNQLPKNWKYKSHTLYENWNN